MLVFWITLLSFLSAALSAPLARADNATSTGCTNPKIRREWRTLTQDQRDTFHKAVKCLQDKPSKLDVDESKNLFDDFTYLHYQINETIHHVASFFPWHRYFLIMREQELEKCGYTDAMPYWDWTRESTPEGFKNSEIFDDVKGFGGNGTGETDWVDGSCLESGPYAGLQVNFPEPHCLTRRFNLTEERVARWSKATLDKIMPNDTYLEFWNNTERFPHDSIHGAVNGDMRRQYSPNEPLFFLHHNQIDRLWTIWQGRNETRLNDYGGNIVQDSFADVASLSDKLYSVGFAPVREVKDFMDTMSNGLCYTYDDAEGGWKYDPEN